MSGSPRRARAGRRALQALTAAALALPGLATGAARAADEPEFSLDYSRHEESERNLAGRTYSGLKLDPIVVDSVAAHAAFPVTDRFQVSVGFTQDTWSGASPVLSLPNAAVRAQLMSGASAPTYYDTNTAHQPVVVNFNACDPVTGVCPFKRDPRLVHLMGSASPETRRQAEVSLSYDWNQAELSLGGGVSEEPDFHSVFVNVGGRFDFDHKRTTLSWAASFTTDRIEANLAANTAADWTLYQDQIGDKHGEPTLFGHRQDGSFSLGVTRVVNRHSLVEAGLVYTHDEGLLMDPYKAVMFAFDDPNQYIFDPNLRFVQLKGVLEERPHLRNEVALTLGYLQYLPRLDAALHLSYRLYTDDWGITAHTFDADWRQPLGHGWMVTPQFRYYSQSQASFYRPFFLFNRPYPGFLGFGSLDWNRIKLREFSSDERLSAFGAVSGGLTIEKTLASGATLEVGYEYYVHSGRLKIDGGGDRSYSDFASTSVHMGMRVPLVARPAAAGGSHVAGAGPDAEAAAPIADPPEPPAGVRMAHTLERAGAFAVDLRYQGFDRDGRIGLAGAALDDQAVREMACGPVACQQEPTRLRQRQLTADLLYAPTDAITLLIAPRLLEGQTIYQPLSFFPLGGIGPRPGPNLSGRHATGGVGDTDVVALVTLFNRPGLRLTGGLGVSAPTGSAAVRLNTSSDLAPYELQRGSGTWDLLPSLTWRMSGGRFSWGAQVSGVARLEGANGAGYRFGDTFEATAWAGWDLTSWLSLSSRGVYSYAGPVTDPLSGQPTHAITSPLDMPANVGGRRFDLGFGLTLKAQGGVLRGDLLSVEWLQPIEDHLNGYQLPRTGGLHVRVGAAF